jgi:hydrogenase nickel incorporation protein HypA/HybF
MHELGITRNLVSIVADAAAGRPVKKVWLEVGQLSALMPDAIRFCFDVVSKGTALEHAELEIISIAAGWQCDECKAPLAVDITRCPHCGSDKLRQRSGEELNIKAMEVEACV